jgi:hypothetical protein
LGVEQLSHCKQLKHLGISFCECLTDQSLQYLKVTILYNLYRDILEDIKWV